MWYCVGILDICATYVAAPVFGPSGANARLADELRCVPDMGVKTWTPARSLLPVCPLKSAPSSQSYKSVVDIQ